ncbi:hypothetical protein, partial [Klebsiella pneumoniae]|uniref:hypothetical protein n=1 Tax=Klebsiella pneumoniae TaxID=573 RepID=UPI00194EFC27
AIGNSAGKGGAHRAAANNQYIDVFIHISSYLLLFSGRMPVAGVQKIGTTAWCVLINGSS